MSNLCVFIIIILCFISSINCQQKSSNTTTINQQGLKGGYPFHHHKQSSNMGRNRIPITSRLISNQYPPPVCPYTFQPYTFQPYTFGPYTLPPYTFRPYTLPSSPTTKSDVPIESTTSTSSVTNRTITIQKDNSNTIVINVINIINSNDRTPSQFQSSTNGYLPPVIKTEITKQAKTTTEKNPWIPSKTID